MSGYYKRFPSRTGSFAHRLLQCLVVAVRPFTVEELAEVLAIDFSPSRGIPKLNEGLRWEDQEQAILSACSSLVAIVEGGISQTHRVVQFSHFSVKEFLTSDRLATSNVEALRYYYIRSEAAHVITAQACLGVLLRLDNQIHVVGPERYPLAPYAADYLGDHTEFDTVMLHNQDGLDLLFDSSLPHFGAMLWVRYRAGHPQRPGVVPLHWAAQQGYRNLVDFLVLKFPEDLTTMGVHGTPLHVALRWGNTDASRRLLGHYANLDVLDLDNNTPLHLAALRGMADIIRTLIERNANVNSKDKKGQTPLHRIISSMSPFSGSYYLAGLRLLLNHDVDVGAHDRNYSTPLHLASHIGSLEATLQLLQHGASVHVRNNKGQTPLHLSSKNMIEPSDIAVAITRSLLEYGADVDAHDHKYSTPLHLALSHGCFEVARLLLEHGANVHVRNDEGRTPLHIFLPGCIGTASDTSVAIARSMLEQGANVDAPDFQHSTPLHLATYDLHLEAIRLLLKHGANAHVKNNWGHTPFQIASSRRHQKIMQLMMSGHMPKYKRNSL